MILHFKKIVNKLKFSNRVKGIFISNYKGCTCLQTFELATSVTNLDSIKISNIDNNHSELELEKIANSKNLLIYAHGDKDRLQCYYKIKYGEVQKDVFIPNKWWDFFGKSDRNVYFHVCHGANILASKPFNTIFKSWVSYKDEVYNVHGGDDRVIKINKMILNGISEALAKRKSPKALKLDIEIVYKSIQSNLFDEDNEYNVYTRTFITSIGHNVNILFSSHD